MVVMCLSPLNNLYNFSKKFRLSSLFVGNFFITTNVHVPAGRLGYIASGKAIALACSNSPLILSARHSALPRTI